MVQGLGLLLVVAAAFAIWKIREVLTILFLAGFLAVALNKPAQALIRRGWSRTRAVTALALAAVFVAVGIFLLVVPVVARQTAELIEAAPEVVDSVMAKPGIAHFNTQLIDGTSLADWLSAKITPEALAHLAGGLLGGAASLMGFLFVSATAAVLSLFVLSGYDRIRSGAYSLVRASRRDRFADLADRILDKVGAYVAGSLGIATVAGVASLIFMLITGIPYAAVLAVVVAAFDLIPQVGATLAAVVVTAVALTQSLGIAVLAVLFFIAYQQTENWIIYPRVMREAVKISNLGALVAVILGTALFGLVGVLIGVPGYAAVQLLLRELVIPRRDAA